MTKRFILNADDFGMSKAVNRAVLEAYEYGFLKSVSLVPNGEFFDEALNEILPKCPDLGVGIHLNITDGTSLCDDIDLLTDANKKFNNSYLQLLIKTYIKKDNEFFSQLEREFRRQIEKVLSKTKVSHINSHSHIHAIPSVFELVCRLAKEYNIREVRTHFEKFYCVNEPVRHFQSGYYANIVKKLVLNLFTVFNENTINKYKLWTNDYLIGIGYSHSLDALAIACGLDVLKYPDITVEAIIHPCRYEEGIIDNRFNEYMITRNEKLKDKIINSGYDITNYVVKSEENSEN